MKILLTGNKGYIGSVLEPMLERAGHKMAIGVADQVETIIHLRAIASQTLGEIDPKTTWQINYFDTIELAKEARRKGIKRFIFPSGMSIFFNFESTYSQTKYFAECKLMSLADENFKVIIIRPGVVWGQSPNMRYDTIVNNFLMNAKYGLKNKPRKPKAIVPIINIKNLCQKIIEALNQDTTIINAVDEQLTAKEIAKKYV